MKRLLNIATGVAMATALVGGSVAAQVAAPPESQRTLITNTRINARGKRKREDE